MKYFFLFSVFNIFILLSIAEVPSSCPDEETAGLTSSFEAVRSVNEQLNTFKTMHQQHPC